MRLKKQTRNTHTFKSEPCMYSDISAGRREAAILLMQPLFHVFPGGELFYNAVLLLLWHW